MAMSSAAPDPEPLGAAEAPPDRFVARPEARLAMLRELAEIGMDLARDLRSRVLAGDEAKAETPKTAEAGPAKGRDPAAAFASLSRAIRLTIALETKTDEALRDLKAGVTRVSREQREKAPEPVRARTAQDRQARAEQVFGLVCDAACAELHEPGDLERLGPALAECLTEDEAFWIDLDRPLRETVERLCKYFRLSPDWTRWDGEGWIDGWPREADPAPEPQPPPGAEPRPASALAAFHALE